MALVAAHLALTVMFGLPAAAIAAFAYRARHRFAVSAGDAELTEQLFGL